MTQQPGSPLHAPPRKPYKASLGTGLLWPGLVKQSGRPESDSIVGHLQHVRCTPLSLPSPEPWIAREEELKLRLPGWPSDFEGSFVPSPTPLVRLRSSKPPPRQGFSARLSFPSPFAHKEGAH